MGEPLEERYLFEEMPVHKAVATLAIPTVISQLVTMVYMADTFFIGQIGNPVMVAAVSLVSPWFNLLTALGNLFGLGGSSLISRMLGAQNHRDVKHVAVFSVWGGGAATLLFSLATYLGRGPLLTFLGASPDTDGYAEGYLFWVVVLGGVPTMVSLTLGHLLRSEGHARQASAGMMFGGILNVVLDPVFIFLFDMGVAGAAVATVLSQLASCLYVLRFLFGKSVPIAITFGGYDGRLMLRILAVGMTPFLIIGVDNIMIISMNAILQSYGGAELGDRLVTCATIAQSFMLVVTMPLGGISAGTGTILAYNYGARRRDRILKAQAFIAGLCVAYVTALFLLARLGGALFVRLFTTEPELAAEALSAIHICTLALIPLGLQYAIVDGFTGMGKVQLALPLSAFRKAVYFIALFALPAVFGARAAFYAEPISDIAGPVVSIAVYALCIRRILDFPADPPAAENKSTLPS